MSRGGASEAATIAELEAALQARWDRETLAVYADALQAAGDPRGELIALDLHAEQHGRTREAHDAKRRAVIAWLGEASPVGPWRPELVRFGLVEDFTITSDGTQLAADHLAALHGSPAGRYLRGATIFLSSSWVGSALAGLAAHPLPWLARLVIDQLGRHGAPPALADLLGDAAPHLRELHLRGDRVIATPLPASIRRLRLDNHTALIIARDGAPGVTELDLMYYAIDAAGLRALAPLVNPRTFPALVRLDLSRNEPVFPAGDPWSLDPLVFVEAIEAPDRLRWLRLPALRTAAAVDAVLRLLDRHPALEIELAGDDPKLAALPAHARLHVSAA